MLPAVCGCHRSVFFFLKRNPPEHLFTWVMLQLHLAMAAFWLFLLLFIILPLSLLILLASIIGPRSPELRIKDRHVFITGGSSGIGLALAERAAAEGARVSILARSQDKLDEARRSIKTSTGVEVATFAADVRDYEAIAKAVDEAEAIDVLIVNQGVFVPGELEKQRLDDVRLMMEVNLMGSFNMIKAALPKMKKREGRAPGCIALVSSQAGQVGIYGYTAYSTTKFGLRGLAEALQHEVISYNIHVSLIFPPDTLTPGFDQEMKIRPELTNILASSSNVMKADEVAKRCLDGIKSRTFLVPCNSVGLSLSISTAGFSPQTSLWLAFIEVLTASILRVSALRTQSKWCKMIHNWHDQNK